MNLLESLIKVALKLSDLNTPYNHNWSEIAVNFYLKRLYKMFNKYFIVVSAYWAKMTSRLNQDTIIQKKKKEKSEV